jgi:CheY-like chemotaxis protein
MTDADKPVLLVEDDPDDQVLIRRAFTKARLRNPLVLARDGDEAVAYLSGDQRQNPLPVLILLDLKLPRRSGLQVLEWLRGQPGPLGRTPVAVLTSSRQNTDVDQAYDRGANSYLVKPVDLDGLLELVKTVGLYWTVLNEAPGR